MIYELTLKNHAADRVTWTYDTERNNLYDHEGRRVLAEGAEDFFKDYRRQSSQHLRIVLGHACNYRCAYCTQNPIKNAPNASTDDIRRFVRRLKAYYDAHFSPHRENLHVTFWGGEPFLYLREMKALVPEIREVFSGEADRIFFGTVTNGSLLKGDAFRFVMDEGIGVSVSYDGPGQFVRNGKDILDKGTETRESAMALMERDGVLGLSAVFHRYNPGTADYLRHTEEKLGTDRFALGEIYYNRIYDEKGVHFACTKEQLERDTAERLSLFLADAAPQMRNVYLRRVAKILKLLGRTEVVADCQTFDQKNFFAVDMAGHLWGCHNIKDMFTDEYGNNIYKGNIHTGEHNILDFAALKKRLPRCRDCLLRWVCCGGCPYTPSKYDDLNCLNYWHFYYPFFAHALYLLSGGGLVEGVRAAGK